ncbi:MAG: hypothetical protein WCD34_12220, partial [Candidatus Acidiferrum sp.]
HRRLRRVLDLYLKPERNSERICVTATVFLFNYTCLHTDHAALGLHLPSRRVEGQAQQEKDYWHWKHALMILMECAAFVAASSASVVKPVFSFSW